MYGGPEVQNTTTFWKTHYVVFSVKSFCFAPQGRRKKQKLIHFIAVQSLICVQLHVPERHFLETFVRLCCCFITLIWFNFIF